jgi:heme exporter protein A
VGATTLEAAELAKAFAGAPLFSELSFRAERGLFAVTGRNGSGKTTLLKILAGLTRPSRGQVRLERDGRELSGKERRLAVGWAGPDLAFYEELDALENLRFFRRAAGREAPDRELESLLESVGLAKGVVRRTVGAYSSGMRQRLRLAFALLFDAPILLLDEPMTGLDPEGRSTAERIVAEARRRGAVFLASNDARDFAEPEREIHLGDGGREPGTGSREP